MANYKVIGGDLKQYGPVSGEDLRKWLAEGRLNAQSLVQLYGDIEWKQLSTFPEFADVFAGKPTTLSPPPPLASVEGDGRQAALQRVKAPAVALLVTAILNILLGLWSLVRMTISPPNLQQLDSELQQLNNPQFEQFMHKLMYLTYGPFGIASNILGLALSVLILIGASKMRSLRSYEFSMTAAILAMIPCLTPCCILGLPFGIWAVVALRGPGVKSQFH
jgi:GYF domain 2